MCDWCGQIHAGDATNCYHEEENETTVNEHPICDAVDKAVKQITQMVKENQNMLPQSDGTTSNRASRGATNKGNRLRVEDLSKEPRDAKILAVKADLEGRYGAQVIAKVAVNGATKFWYLDIKKNPNYKILTAKFGHDENEWAGQKILLGLEQDEFSDNWFVRVSFPAARKEK